MYSSFLKGNGQSIMENLSQIIYSLKLKKSLQKLTKIFSLISHISDF